MIAWGRKAKATLKTDAIAVEFKESGWYFQAETDEEQ
jgi:hypothetical protein